MTLRKWNIPVSIFRICTRDDLRLAAKRRENDPGFVIFGMLGTFPAYKFCK